MWKAGFRGRAARLRKHPKTAAVSAPPRRWPPAPTGAGRPKFSFRASRPPPPRDPALRPRSVRSRRLRDPCITPPQPPLLPGRPPGTGRPAAQAGEGGRRRGVSPPPAPLGEGAGNGWGKGPRGAATRHSRVELVVHPLTAAVATASRSDFRSAGSPLQLRARLLPAAQGAAERLRAGPVWGGYAGTPALGGCAEAPGPGSGEGRGSWR